MKQQLIRLLLPCVIILTNCKIQFRQHITPPQMSWEQVMATAKKYGVQDLINQNDNSGLVLMEPEDLHVYMLDLKKYIERDK